MILDKISNASTYDGLMPGIARALNEMRNIRTDNYPSEKVEIDGDNLFYLPGDYETHDRTIAQMEAHRKYLDVMYMVDGEETIYVKSTELLSRVDVAYNTENDSLLAPLDEDASAIRLTTGCFIVLFPQDAHAPACFANGSSRVRKLIAKVKIR